jgi:hypothetical protein
MGEKRADASKGVQRTRTVRPSRMMLSSRISGMLRPRVRREKAGTPLPPATETATVSLSVKGRSSNRIPAGW